MIFIRQEDGFAIVKIVDRSSSCWNGGVQPRAQGLVQRRISRSLFANDQAFLHKPLDEDDLLVVFQIARKLANGIGRAVQREIQGLAEETREDNGPGAEVQPDGFVTGMR